jgi:protein-disulfide isomerase
MRKLTTAFLLPLLLSFAHCAKSDDPGNPGEAKPAAVKRAPDEVAAPAVRVPVDGFPAFGSARALVTIVAFTDYQCPYCAKADERFAELRAEYGDRVRMVVVTRPLPFHENAADAARAFLAANELGKGEAMHTRLFAKQDALDDAGLREAARSIGLDVAAFDRVRKSPSVEALLERAEKLWTALGVDGTPTFFINGRRLVGARPIETFRATIDEELTSAGKLVAEGIAPERLYATQLDRQPEHVLKSKSEPEKVLLDIDVEGGPTRGPARAATTIVFFSDFECPYCVRAEKTLREVEAANPGNVKIVFRHKPLPFHAHARMAAKASIAAERQGRFWEYHDVLVEHRDALERADLERYATEIGLDRARFSRDLDDPALDARLEADEARAAAAGVTGTPTSFVNGRRVLGAQPTATWLKAIAAVARP